MVGLLDFVQDVTGLHIGVLEEMRLVTEALDAVQAFDSVEEPGTPPDLEVEARVAIHQDVETRAFLLVDVAGDRVGVLLAIERIAERHLERPPAQTFRVPRRPRKRPHHGGGKHQVFRRLEHGDSSRR